MKDTGVGIKDEDKTKLFKQFGFLDATREINVGGIGLGLHISNKSLSSLKEKLKQSPVSDKEALLRLHSDFLKLSNNNGMLRG